MARAVADPIGTIVEAGEKAASLFLVCQEVGPHDKVSLHQRRRVSSLTYCLKSVKAPIEWQMAVVLR